MRRLAAAAALVLCASQTSAFAQDAGLSDVDSLIDASASPEGALQAAADQASAGDVSGAATTLERALIGAPDSIELRTAYTAYLCELDDRQAADFEIAKLAGGEISDANWATVQAACGPVAKPVQ